MPHYKPINCKWCGRPILSLKSAVASGKRLYHKKCWTSGGQVQDNAIKESNEKARRSFIELFENAESEKAYTIKYGSKIIKRKGQKLRRRPYVKEIHIVDNKKHPYHINIDVTHLRPYVRKDIEDKYGHVFVTQAFFRNGGPWPWTLKLATTEHKVAKACKEKLSKKKFVKIERQEVYGRKYYLVYTNEHKWKNLKPEEQKAHAEYRRTTRDIYKINEKKLNELNHKVHERNTKEFRYIFDAFKAKAPEKIDMLIVYPRDVINERDLMDWLRENFLLYLDASDGTIYRRRLEYSEDKLVQVGVIVGYEDKSSFLDRYIRIKFNAREYIERPAGETFGEYGQMWKRLLNRAVEIYSYKI